MGCVAVGILRAHNPGPSNELGSGRREASLPPVPSAGRSFTPHVSQGFLLFVHRHKMYPLPSPQEGDVGMGSAQCKPTDAPGKLLWGPQPGQLVVAGPAQAPGLLITSCRT